MKQNCRLLYPFYFEKISVVDLEISVVELEISVVELEIQVEVEVQTESTVCMSNRLFLKDF